MVSKNLILMIFCPLASAFSSYVAIQGIKSYQIQKLLKVFAVV